jgi:ArsR family transcriptional regulator, arsenate/arsenite/antimonite-responsive transcriptional repressor / arsenate reductase (thioredoxin)
VIDSFLIDADTERVTEPDLASDITRRAQCHAALADPGRLAIVDELLKSDRTPSELGRLIGAPSNLLAHHLDTLETAGLIGRTRSTGDARRRYVHVIHDALPSFSAGSRIAAQPALFLCTRNSARSQLAAALWTAITGKPAQSAGTRPADHIHKLAVSAARRVGLTIGDTPPRHINSLTARPGLTITVCDQVHEELDPPAEWLHWSLPDPVADGHAAAFDASVRTIRKRISALLGPVAA